MSQLTDEQQKRALSGLAESLTPRQAYLAKYLGTLVAEENLAQGDGNVQTIDVIAGILFDIRKIFTITREVFSRERINEKV